ncbi:undecaprenyl-diphosphatase [Paenibacillus sp. HWE-109]|uniref:undecaprenyl-diphosphatase n=1 Tax=Paenibacillus sp. HWE-109 TaxID=1306526 RepID=UPI001EDEC332|nr:undecaprenyl-diphosphatase [Paenibacillus sp. HWE-109]UKS25518.1 undecaprenyl-diphosphatase [Paenibacillus sp. HWE-109]
MSFTKLDYDLFQMINQLGDKFSFLNPLMCLFASQAEYVFYLGIVIYWFMKKGSHRRMVTEAILSACLAFMGSVLISKVYYEDRPFVSHHVLQLISHPANASFPSDHAIGAFVIATTIWLHRRKAGRLWLVLAGCIALSRVWTGVHYPSDVIGGAIIGALAACVVHRVFKRSSLALKWMNRVIQWYETIESKVWRGSALK